MKLCLKILAIAVIATTTNSLIGCAGPSVATATPNPVLSLTVTCSDCETYGIQFAPTNNMGQTIPVPTSNSSPLQAVQSQVTSTVIPQPNGVLSPIMLVDNQGQGGTFQLFAAVNGVAASNVTWTVYPTPVSPAEPNAGTGLTCTGSGCAPGEISAPYGQINVQSNSGATYSWAAGGATVTGATGVPYYAGTALEEANAMGIPQGDVMIYVTAQNPNDPSNPADLISTTLLLQIVNLQSGKAIPNPFLAQQTPTNLTGVTTTSVATVPRNGTFLFYGGTLGNGPCESASACGANPLFYTDNTSIWEIGALASGKLPTVLSTCTTAGSACPEGTIVQAPPGTPGYPYTAIYTAPATIPANQPCIYVVPNAVPTTTTAYACITVD
jgi:hypothetical protein